MKFAEDIFTIDAEKFKNKWNFDVNSMKPVETKTKNYQWELLESKEDLKAKKEKKEHQASLFSLIPSNPRQLLLNTVRVTEKTESTKVEEKSEEANKEKKNEVSEKELNERLRQKLESLDEKTPQITVSSPAKLDRNSSNGQTKITGKLITSLTITI